MESSFYSVSHNFVGKWMMLKIQLTYCKHNITISLLNMEGCRDVFLMYNNVEFFIWGEMWCSLNHFCSNEFVKWLRIGQLQTFTYSFKEYVCHSSLHHQWFLQLSFFCNRMSGTHTTLPQKNIVEVCFKSEFINGFLKTWTNLLAQKYAHSNFNNQFRWL